jgi:hypothetical protein
MNNIILVERYDDLNIYKKLRNKSQGDLVRLRNHLINIVGGNIYYVGFKLHYGCYFINKHDFLNYLLPDTAGFFYEQVIPNCPIYEFYDIDSFDSGWDIFINSFLSKRRAFMDNFYDKDVRILVAGDNSLHLIIRSCIFKDVYQLKNFAVDFAAESGIKIDECVYGVRLFRCPYSTKNGELRPFIPVDNHPIDEYLIQWEFQQADNSWLEFIHYNVPVLPREPSRRNNPPSSEPIVGNRSLTKIINKFLSQHPEFQLQNISDSLKNLIRVTPSKCFVKDYIQHNTQNSYMVITETEVFVGCYTHRNLQYIGTWKKLNRVEKIRRSISYYTDILETPLIHLDETKINKQNTVRHINTCYISDCLDGVATERVTAIKSPTGSGKSHFFKNKILEKYPTLLVISFRQAFADFMSKLYGIGNYMTNDYDKNKLVVSVENLFKIQNRIFDLLYLDELSSILTQLTSKVTCKDNLYLIQCVFIKLLKNTKTIVITDANLNHYHINLINELCGRNIEFIINDDLTPTAGRTVEIVYDKNDALKKLRELLDDGNKVAVPYTLSRIQCKALEKTFDDYKGLVITKDTENRNELFKNLSEISNNYDFVTYTNTLTAGNSVDNENYNYLVAFFCRKISSPDIIAQMLNRFRSIKKAYVYIDNTIANHPVFDTDEDIEDFLINDIIMNGMNKVKIPSSIYDVENRRIKPDATKLISYTEYKLKGMYYNNFIYYLFAILKENRWNICVDKDNYTELEEGMVQLEIHTEDSKNERLEEIVSISESFDLTEKQYLKLKNENVKTLEESYACQKYKFISSFNCSTVSDDELTLYMKKLNHNPGYASLYRLKNILNIRRNPLITLYDWSSGDCGKLIKSSLGQTSYFLYNETKLPRGVCDLITDFLGESISHEIVGESCVVANRDKFYESSVVSVNTTHTRYMIVFDWIKLLGFTDIFDFDTIITQERRDDIIYNICERYTDYDEYDKLYKIFGLQTNVFKKFVGNVKTKNYTQLSKFISSKILNTTGVKLERFQLMSNGDRESHYRLNIDTSCIPYILSQNGEQPCLFTYEQITDLQSKDIDFLKHLHTRTKNAIEKRF